MKLKEIVGYLPHGLNVYTKTLDTTFTIVEKKPINHSNERTINDFIVYKDQLKPILRPLNSIDVNDIISLTEKSYPECGIDLCFVDLIILSKIKDGRLKDLPYWFYEYCFENHYDIYGLIEKNEAIDINCL